MLYSAYPLSGLNRIDTLRNCVGTHDRTSLQHRVTRERVQANNSWCRSDQGFCVHGSSVGLNSTETSLSAAGSELHKNRDKRWKRLADVLRDGITGITLCTFCVDVCAALLDHAQYRSKSCRDKILLSQSDETPFPVVMMIYLSLTKGCESELTPPGELSHRSNRV